jgi:hypothetical protein
MQSFQQNNGPTLTYKYSTAGRSPTTIKELTRQASFWSVTVFRTNGLRTERLQKCATINLLGRFCDEVQIKITQCHGLVTY